MSAVSGHRSEDPFDHRALYYRDGRGYLEGIVPFIEAGLAAGDPVAVPGPTLDLLRTALGQTAEDVRMLDMAEVGADPGRLLNAADRPLDPPPWTAVERAVDHNTIGNARQFTLTYGRHAGLDADRLIDLQIAITELATHCVLCGGGTGTLRIWTERDQLVCQTEDPGHLAGHHPFAEEDACGRNLMVIDQVVDLLRLHTGPHGTTLRIHLNLP